MNVEYYDYEKSKFNKLNDIKGYFRNFDQTKDKISDFKLIFILPNGEYLLMPYSENEIRGSYEIEYSHTSYLSVALELILQRLNINRENFIKNKVEHFNGGFIEKAILDLGICDFYDTYEELEDGTEKKYTIFGKPFKLTEKQEGQIMSLRNSLQNEKYKFGITTLLQDKSIKDEENYKRIENKVSQYFCGKKHDIDVNIFFDILGIEQKI